MVGNAARWPLETGMLILNARRATTATRVYRVQMFRTQIGWKWTNGHELRAEWF